MCLVVLDWQPGSDLPLKGVANRDEFRARPTAPMAWWDEPGILAGKDLEAGGAWLGFDRRGRFALVTNIRAGRVRERAPRSRGHLVTEFLGGAEGIERFHRVASGRLDDYAPFNMILGAGDELFWFSSAEPRGRWLAPGIHVLSNAALDTPWPKATLARRQMAAEGAMMAVQLAGHGILASREAAADGELPDTGVPQAREKMLSAQTITGVDYGTRSRTHFIRDARGHFRVCEQQLDADGRVAGERGFSTSRNPAWRARGSAPGT